MPPQALRWQSLMVKQPTAALPKLPKINTFSSSLFDCPGNAIVIIFKHKGVEDIIHWADDYIFLRYPSGLSSLLLWAIGYTLMMKPSPSPLQKSLVGSGPKTKTPPSPLFSPTLASPGTSQTQQFPFPRENAENALTA
ncbi:hypothetical protein PAXRUDRAFT_17372 [Paxillus rubicundulus Ve08.2h10]|uniref:Uncharacterized protein n=1 Tax=Paxillus rubicundulus Ve08.2h10 TaxID=930991 RepID=A0A0D0DAQ3_9AGAM|nr:hypothetical protein PAXRUDRAFT_17372 [Paxillus rubicundulus Ve08.2h10]